MSGILRTKKLLNALFKFTLKEHSVENLLFLMEEFDPEKMHAKYFEEDSRREINLSFAAMGPIRQLAAAKDWRNPAWADHIKVAKNQIRELMEKDTLLRFFKSKEFWDLHVANGGSRDENYADLPEPELKPWERAAEHFKLKTRSALLKYIDKFEREGETATIGLADRLLRSEGKKMNAHQFNLQLIAEGFAEKPRNFEGTPAPTPEPEDPADSLAEIDEETGEEILVDVSGIEIKLHSQALRKCGFKQLNKTADFERIRDMVRAYLAKDRQEAIKLYERILKVEKGNKTLDMTTFVEIMKKMRKTKAFEVSRAG